MGRLIPPVAKEKVLQWFPMHEGSGDVVGYSGGTRNGPTWVEDDKWMGGYALDGDGVDDYVETTNWGEFGAGLDSGWAVAFTIENTTGEGHILGAVTSGNSELRIAMNKFEAETGELRMSVRDDDDQLTRVKTDENYHDGNVHRVILNSPTNDVRDARFHVDAIAPPYSIPTDNGLSTNFTRFNETVPLFARLNDDLIDDNIDAVLDDVIIYGDSLTESEIQQDYLRQHWS